MSGILVKKVITDEGEVIPYYMKSIDFGVELDGGEDFFQMFWPVTVCHRITEESELYELSSRDISCRSQSLLSRKSANPFLGPLGTLFRASNLLESRNGRE